MKNTEYCRKKFLMIQHPFRKQECITRFGGCDLEQCSECKAETCNNEQCLFFEKIQEDHIASFCALSNNGQHRFRRKYNG